MSANTAAGIRAAHRPGRIASLPGIVGGYAIENSPGAPPCFSPFLLPEKR